MNERDCWFLGFNRFRDRPKTMVILSEFFDRLISQTFPLSLDVTSPKFFLKGISFQNDILTHDDLKTTTERYFKLKKTFRNVAANAIK